MSKTVISTIAGLCIAGLAFWIVTTTATIPENPLALVALALIFGVSPLGSFWMMYAAIRHEKKPLPYILLAFIPYAAVGYYFDRIRGRESTPPS